MSSGCDFPDMCQQIPAQSSSPSFAQNEVGTQKHVRLFGVFHGLCMPDGLSIGPFSCAPIRFGRKRFAAPIISWFSTSGVGGGGVTRAP